MPRTQYPSFVRRSDTELDLWSPVVTGEWSVDMEQGQSYGREIVSFMRENGHIPFLHHVVKAMVGHGSWGGVETGFMQIISIEAVGLANISRALATKYDYFDAEEEESSETAT